MTDTLQLAIPKDTHPNETRATMIPADIKKLVASGLSVVIETTAGMGLYSDDMYIEAGATIANTSLETVKNADIVLRVRKPEVASLNGLKKGAIHVSFMDPNNSPDFIKACCEQQITSIALEMIPRSTRAQKMDILSSQANLGGYVAVILATEKLAKILPMMTTPAGTLSPARVFVIGVGVAGLQAIATAKRLGARVEAFDTRPVVEEQVQSLGAKFVKIDLGTTSQTTQGYATQLTEDQINKQRELLAKHVASADIVITTAQIFGKKAPVIVTDPMVQGMAPGSVIVDMAIESGGNVEGSALDQVITRHGVHVMGISNLPGHVAVHASQMLSANLFHLIQRFWNGKTINLNFEDDILAGCVVSHAGKIVHPGLRESLKG
jgi:H+-translocating NAD(P) transhydrogenase subunit alpha